MRKTRGENHDATLERIRAVLQHYPRVKEMIETAYLDLNADFMKALGEAVQRDHIHRVMDASYRKYARGASPPPAP